MAMITGKTAKRRPSVFGDYAKRPGDWQETKDQWRSVGEGIGLLDSEEGEAEPTMLAVPSVEETPETVQEDTPTDLPTVSEDVQPAEESEASRRLKRKDAAYSQFQATYAKQMEKFDIDSESLDAAFNKQMKESQAIYSAASANTESRQMWEGIIQGIAHLAAGIIGHQTGLDLSGVKFDKRNWDAEKNRIQQDNQNRKQTLLQSMSQQQRKLAERRATAYQDYNVTAQGLDRALQQVRHEDTMALREREGMLNRADKIAAAMARGVTDEKKQTLKEYNQHLNNIYGQLKAKKGNPKLIITEINKANDKARSLGFPEPYPEDITEDVNVWYSSTDRIATVKEMTERLMLGSKTTAPIVTKDASHPPQEQDGNIYDWDPAQNKYIPRR